MMRSLLVPPEQLEQLIGQAIYHHTEVALSCRLLDGWASFQSRFLGSAGDGRQMVVAYPTLDRLCPPEFAGGEHVGIGFRRGHKRCIFSTLVIRQCRFTMTRTVHVAALVLAWPDEVYELQRRLYYRAPVPCGRELQVEVQRLGRTTGGPATHRGTVLDLSVGGMSIRLDEEPGWRRDHAIVCSLADDAGAEPLVLPARVCHCGAENGGVRLGVRFTELDTSPDTGALARVVRLCSDFQRIEMARSAAALSGA